LLWRIGRPADKRTASSVSATSFEAREGIAGMASQHRDRSPDSASHRSPLPAVRRNPLSQTDLPIIADAIHKLIHVLQTIRPGKPAPDKPEQAKQELLTALMPRGVKDCFGGDTDITESDLDTPVRAKLKQLRRFLLDRPINIRARFEKEETITHLETVLSGLAAKESGHHTQRTTPKGEPGRRPKYTEELIKFVLRQRAKRPQPNWKDVFAMCKKQFPDLSYPKRQLSFVRSMQRRRSAE
jgi:hypothetical protein